MLYARLSNGTFLLGLDAENVRRLQAGEPIEVDLRRLGGHDKLGLLYGEALADIEADLVKLTGGPLPPAQPLPPVGEH